MIFLLPTFRIKNQTSDIEYRDLSNGYNDDDDRGGILMQQNHRPRREHVLEAQIQEGDTLQAIALRFNCTVSMCVCAFWFLLCCSCYDCYCCCLWKQ